MRFSGVRNYSVCVQEKALSCHISRTDHLKSNNKNNDYQDLLEISAHQLHILVITDREVSGEGK
jgi:hypothetical protein